MLFDLLSETHCCNHDQVIRDIEGTTCDPPRDDTQYHRNNRQHSECNRNPKHRLLRGLLNRKRDHLDDSSFPPP